MKTILLVATLILSSTSGDLLVTHAMKQLGDVRFQWRKILGQIRRGIVNPYLGMGIACMAISFFSFLSLLSYADLSYVMPLIAVDYILGSAGAWFFLKEQISPQRLLGAALVAFGVTLVSLPDEVSMTVFRSMMRPGHDAASTVGACLYLTLTFLRLGLLVSAISSIVYSGLALWAGRLWSLDRRRQRAQSAQCAQSALWKNFTPPVSMLVPVRGLHSEAYEIFSRLCEQHYPAYQIIFGVRDDDDPVLPVLRKLQSNFPDVSIDVIVSHIRIGTNEKVSNLHNMVSAARHDVFVILDSDIRVTPDYLGRVIAPLQSHKVGMVTCLYRGSKARSFAALLENIGISSTFAAEVVTARALEGIRFGLGSTMVMRREMLEQIGGFRAVADYLADDFHLGQLVSKAGFEICLSDYVVEHVGGAESFSSMVAHQIRWGRTTRIARPKGYFGLILTYGSVTSILFLAIMNFSTFAWGMLAAVISCRLIVAWTFAVWIMQDDPADEDRAIRRSIWLIPLRDFLSFYVWMASLMGNEVHWSGTRYEVFRGGKFRPLAKTVES